MLFYGSAPCRGARSDRPDKEKPLVEFLHSSAAFSAKPNLGCLVVSVALTRFYPYPPSVNLVHFFINLLCQKVIVALSEVVWEK
jgi:hypothetical protein